MTTMNNSVNTFEKDPHHLEFCDGLFHVLTQRFFNIGRSCHRVKGREDAILVSSRQKRGLPLQYEAVEKCFFPTTLIHETTECPTTTVSKRQPRKRTLDVIILRIKR